MARALTFEYDGVTFEAEINRVDRSKLYGSVEVQTLDQEGNRCALATLAGDGRTLIGNGGTAFGYLNEQGEWIDRKDLVPVDSQGDELPEAPSSFSVTTQLHDKAEVSVETYLDHSIRLCYELAPVQPMPGALSLALNRGKIFKVPFSYRGGVNPDNAFLMTDESDKPWLMVAEASDVEAVSLEQAAICGTNRSGEEDETEDDEAGDGLDFTAL